MCIWQAKQNWLKSKGFGDLGTTTNDIIKIWSKQNISHLIIWYSWIKHSHLICGWNPDVYEVFLLFVDFWDDWAASNYATEGTGFAASSACWRLWVRWLIALQCCGSGSVTLTLTSTERLEFTNFSLHHVSFSLKQFLLEEKLVKHKKLRLGDHQELEVHNLTV